MLYFTSYNARAYALKESNFDDCQSFVKAMLVKHENEGYTSANSINTAASIRSDFTALSPLSCIDV